METLKNICDDRIFDRSYMASLAKGSKAEEARQSIYRATAWLPETFNLKSRCLAIHLGYDEKSFPRCPCGAFVVIEKAHQRSFTTYCSDPCAKKHRNRLGDAKAKLKDYDWMYEHRITKRMSKEDIADLLGCSVTPVNKAIEDHKLPDLKYNSSNEVTLAVLNDREWLYEQHVNQKRTLEDIAKELGSSKATLSLWLKKVGIEANNSNAYDRKFIRRSKEEQELIDFLKDILPEEKIETGVRRILGGQEIDILIPGRSIGIEYNGVFHHAYRPDQENPSLRKDRNYHLDKTLKAKAAGYQLIHIFSDDWVLRKDIWKSILKAKFGVWDRRIGARKCQIKAVPRAEKRLFLDENHLQGKDRSHIAYGLYHQEELVALMTFTPSRYNKAWRWELSRFCVARGIHVPGAFSRLLAHFRASYEGSIISYADYARSNGEVYRKNGFEYLHHSPPAYAYINPKNNLERMHRARFRKSKLNEDGTESEIMARRGYRRIWDCGVLAFGLR